MAMAFWGEMDDEEWDDFGDEPNNQYFYGDLPPDEEEDEEDIMAYFNKRKGGNQQPEPTPAPQPQRVVYEEPKPTYRDRDEVADIGSDLYRDTMGNTATVKKPAEVKRRCMATGKKFDDEEFPPDDSSLCKDWSTADYQTQDDWRNFGWKRVDEIYNQPIKVFEGIEPNDIKQGQLGDCYFLSVLSAMAEFPHRIEKLFDTQEFQESGCYTINICDMGIWQDVTVDDYFPTYGNAVAFSGPQVEKNITEIWVLLLEKAWAKLFGSYYIINAGFTEDALRDLTGAPCENIMHDDESLWDKVYKGNQANYIMTAASTGTEGAGDLVNQVGLVTLHAYAVIDAQEVQTRDGPEQILEIRNPWGQTEWTGDWSDNSSKWTPELKRQLNLEAADDGRFWMCLADFCHYFSMVTICRVHDNYYYQSLKSHQPGDNFTVSSVTVPKDGTMYVIVTQEDMRRFGGEESGYDYSPVRIVLAKVEGDKLIYKGGFANSYLRDVWEQYDVEAGEYLVYTEVDWIDESFTDDVGLSVYCDSDISMKNVTTYHKDFMSRVYSLDLAQQEAEEKSLGQDMYFYSGVHVGADRETGKFMEGFMYDVIENRSRDSNLWVEVFHKAMQNVKLCEPYNGDTYEVNLGPGESAVVVKQQESLLEGQAYSIGLRKKIS